jgi:hypothetical protein
MESALGFVDDLGDDVTVAWVDGGDVTPVGERVAA